MTTAFERMGAPPRTPRTSGGGAPQGFSFIEVLIALTMLLVGCLAILPLFALGVQNLAQRRAQDALRRLSPEVLVICQQEVDRSAGVPKDRDPAGRKVYPLSMKDYDVQIEWIPSPSKGPGITALAAVRHNGVVVSTLPPIALSRSTLDPAGLVAPAPKR